MGRGDNVDRWMKTESRITHGSLKLNMVAKEDIELSTDEPKMAEGHLSKCSTSLVIREKQIKTTLRFHLTL